MSWSQRRRFTYASLAIIILIGAVGVPLVLTFYRAPSCTDGKQNGSELGVDCGGSCERLCQSAYLPPVYSWTRFEQVAKGLYNVAAYIRNPNADGEATRVPFTITLYDKEGTLITVAKSYMTIPPHRNTLAFIPAVDVGKTIPERAVFEFTAAPNWHARTDPLRSVNVTGVVYSETASNSSLTATLSNTDVSSSVGPFAVYAVLYDAHGNAIGFSRTMLDSIDPASSAIAPFTWPISRHGEVISKEILPVTE